MVAEAVEWWRPKRGVAHALTWLLVALAVGQVLTPIVIDRGDQFERQHRALVAVFDGRWRAAGRIVRHADNGPPGWGFVLSLVSLAVSVLLIVWTWRSMHNARALGRTGARLSPGWAIAGWLIPVAALVLPY